MSLNDALEGALKDLTPFFIVLNGLLANQLIIHFSNSVNIKILSLSISIFGSYILFSAVIYMYDRHLSETGGSQAA